MASSVKALARWLVVVACLRLLSVYIGIFSPEYFRTKLIDLRPDLGERDACLQAMGGTVQHDAGLLGSQGLNAAVNVFHVQSMTCMGGCLRPGRCSHAGCA